MTKKISSILCACIISLSSFAQNLNNHKLDNYFDALEKSDRFMGSVALSQNGKIVYTRSVGFANVEAKTKANENTKYRIGSISKTFTSTLVFKAIEENKLSLIDKLSKYYPAVKNADKITISNLLNHRSGIHNFTDDESYLSWNTQKKSEKEMLEIIVAGGSDFVPDSKAEYSNSNYVLLSYILEKVYKKPYAKILSEKIISPLGLKNTVSGNKINVAHNESNSYQFSAGWKKERETDLSIPMGAGAVVSTPSDLLQFADALFNGKILSAKSLEQMKTMKDDYGFGLFQIPFNDKISYGHTGGIDEFTSVYGYFVDEKTGFALCSNGTNYTNNNISLVLLSAIFNAPYEIPDFKTFTVSAEQLSAYKGVYSSHQIPLKITITQDENTLMAQATGQSAFPLEASEKDKFKFEQGGIVIEFNPAENKMILKQGGGNYSFTKE